MFSDSAWSIPWNKLVTFLGKEIFAKLAYFMPNFWVDKKSACHNIYVFQYVRDLYSVSIY